MSGGRIQLIDVEPTPPAESRAEVGREEAVSPDRPLVPALEEVAKLPRLVRVAFAARCAARVAPLRPGLFAPEAAAALILTAATSATPVRKQLLCIRRDFDRLARLAREQNWTDETPVPPEVFGPMWPNGLAPAWVAGPGAPGDSVATPPR